MNRKKNHQEKEQAKGLAFWDVLMHHKKKIGIEEYANLSKDLDDGQLYAFAKKAFSSIALCGFLMYLTVYIIQTLIYSLVSLFITSSQLLSSIAVDITSLTFAIVAFPLLYVLTSFMPKVVPIQKNLSPGQLILFAIAAFGLVFVGNLLGSGASYLVDLITGSQSVSPVESALKGLDPFKIIIYFVIFPAVFEELIFRKLIIDHTAFFGQSASVLFSALFFALYHMNFYQFFYAFLVGYLFGIIYIKTGKLTCTITLHGFINFVGAALPSMLSDLPNFTEIYNIAVLVLGIGGIIVILLGLSYARSLNGRYTPFVISGAKIFPEPPSLKGSFAVKSVFCNPGMIIFIVFAILNFINIF